MSLPNRTLEVRPVRDEELPNLRMEISSRQPQRFIVTCAHISAVLDEELHNSCVAILRGCPQRIVV